MRLNRQESMDCHKLIEFLRYAMNYGKMQIWLMRQKILGKELALNDELKKFFKLNSNNDILLLYDISQNYNDNNLHNIKRTLVKKH